MRVARSLELPYPQEVVFDYLADLRNELSWHPDVESVEQTTGGDVGQGTHFTARYRRLGTVEIELAEYDRPWRLAFESTGAAQARYIHRLEAKGAATKLVTVADAPLRGLGKLLAPLFRGRIQRDFRKRGELLAEGLASSRPQAQEPHT